MKSRLVILSMLVLGMLLSTAGAGLAFRAAAATPRSRSTATPTPTAAAASSAIRMARAPRRRRNGGAARHPVEANPCASGRGRRGTTRGSSLPFTGFAAIPILLGGIVLLTAGLLLRRRTGDKR